MRLIALAAVSALILSACSQPEEPAAPPPAPEPPAVLAGVDLTKPVLARGTEPFWSVELTGTEMVYGGLDRPEQRAPQPKATVQGTTATFEGVTASGTSLNVMLAATECSDGMSDLTYPLSAIVKIGDETLNGCAGSSAALRTAGESGPVVEPATPAA
jgi:uncharacterized membrane protein